MRLKYILCAILLLILTGCGAYIEDAENNKNSEIKLEEKEGAKKQVVFKNYVNEITTTYKENWKLLKSSYEAEEGSLYAFSVSFVGFNDGAEGSGEQLPDIKDYEDASKWNLDYVVAVHESIKELMLEQGLMVLPECSYYSFNADKTKIFEDGWSSCVVVGTMDKILEVFSEENYYKTASDGLVENEYFKIGNWLLKVKEALRPDYVDIVRKCGWKEKSTPYHEWVEANQNKVYQVIGKEKEIVLEVLVIEPETIPDTSVEGVTKTVDVVFSNHVKQGILIDLVAPTPKTLLDVPQLGEEDTLYACYLWVRYLKDDRITTYELETIADMVKEKGFIVLEDYPYCYYKNEHLYNEELCGAGRSKQLVIGHMVIVGTYEQFKEVFGKRHEYAIDKYKIDVQLAVRPDYVDYLKQCGYTGEESGGIYVWSQYYTPQIEEKLGGKYCTLEIEVTCP